MSKIITIKGQGIILPESDIDTDRIIPSRFLRCVSFKQLGKHVFADDRKALKKKGNLHPFDQKKYQKGNILITGENFGSGSSREHAVHALMKSKHQIQAIIANGKYSEIFFGNALANGLPCLILNSHDWKQLISQIKQKPDQKIVIQIDKMLIQFGTNQAKLKFQHQEAKQSFLSGSWDQILQLSQEQAKIVQKIKKMPYL